jgi:hypothetical protein
MKSTIREQLSQKLSQKIPLVRDALQQRWQILWQPIEASLTQVVADPGGWYERTKAKADLLP